MNKYLVKISESKDKLRPHQERALKKLEQTNGLILDHSTGSGKTLTFLKAVERALDKNEKGRALIIAPASLQTNIDKEVKKHNLHIDLNRVDVRSYEKAVIDADKLRKNKYLIAVADEAHRFRETNTQRHKELNGIIAHADQRLLSTGTTGYNHVSNIAPLINIAAGGKGVLPVGKKAFENAYVSKLVEQPPFLKRILGSPPKETHILKNKKDLANRLNTFVDHYDVQDHPKDAKEFPTKTEKIIEVEMSPEQQTMYKYLENRLPFLLRLKVRNNLPLDKKESANLNAFSSGIRMASNSVHPFMPKHEHVTPKIQTAVGNLINAHNQDKNFRGLVYSNFLQAGLDDYSKELGKAGISHAVYNGKLSKTQKDELVNDYNEGKNKVLLISSAGGEGLNLKGTKLVQVLEPHYNRAKVHQVISRGVRYKSHEHLPELERQVNVEHYHSVFPKKKFTFGPKQHSIDSYLYHNSKTKDDLDVQMKKLLKDD